MEFKIINVDFWKGGPTPDETIKVRFNYGNRYEFLKHLADRTDIAHRWSAFIEVTDLPSTATSKFIQTVKFNVRKNAGPGPKKYSKTLSYNHGCKKGESAKFEINESGVKNIRIDFDVTLQMALFDNEFREPEDLKHLQKLTSHIAGIPTHTVFLGGHGSINQFELEVNRDSLWKN